jgi:hypothetical protein
VDKLAEFKGAVLGEIEIKLSQVQFRVLEVAIPGGTTAAQMTEVQRAIQYGQSRGVMVRITEVIHE